MRYVDVMKYCLGLPGAQRQALNPAGNAFALTVSRPDTNVRRFAYFETGAPIQWHFSIRVTPEHFERLHNPPQVRQASDKDDDLWMTIRSVETFESMNLLALIDWSYQKALED